MPASCCLRTIARTASRPARSISAASTASPRARSAYSRVNSRGRGRLPVWVVNILEVERCIGSVFSSRHMIRQPKGEIGPHYHQRQHHEHRQMKRNGAEDHFAQFAVPDALDDEQIDADRRRDLAKLDEE